jgi:hypothetical protein
MLKVLTYYVVCSLNYLVIKQNSLLYQANTRFFIIGLTILLNALTKYAKDKSKRL